MTQARKHVKLNRSLCTAGWEKKQPQREEATQPVSRDDWLVLLFPFRITMTCCWRLRGTRRSRIRSSSSRKWCVDLKTGMQWYWIMAEFFGSASHLLRYAVRMWKCSTLPYPLLGFRAQQMSDLLSSRLISEVRSRRTSEVPLALLALVIHI